MRLCQLFILFLSLLFLCLWVNPAIASNLERDVDQWLALKKSGRADWAAIESLERRHPDWPIIKSRDSAPKQASGWRAIHLQVREALEDKQYQRAYNLVNATHYKEGSDFADAEFLKGFIQLQFLNNPRQALYHFDTLYRGVNSVISKSRASYWAGRAARASGDQLLAQKWYDVARSYPVTFFGQRAFEDQNISLTRQNFVRSYVMRTSVISEQDTRLFAARYLYQKNEDSFALAFLLSLARDAQSLSDFDRLYAIARDNQDRIAMVKLARREGVAGLSPGLYGYPVLSANEQAQIKRAGMQHYRAFVHAVIRQESEFDHLAHSSADAQGMMQLLPSTAKQVARRLGVSHSTAMLKSDPAHNILLGSAYLKSLLERYNGSTILAAAAYNAGSGRVDDWIKRFGDPRTQNVLTENWIELIPFSETRNYIQRVKEAEAIYKTLL